MDKITEKRLRSPEAAYRGKPFWSWNGELEKEELLRQIGYMKEMGFGGFFMHSRTGLITEYLGEEWFRFIRNCARRGAELGMESWIYDEDRWPSGTCGGLVTRDRKYRLRFISEYGSDEEALACPDVEKILCRRALKLEDGELCDSKEVKSRAEVPQGYTYAVYAEELMHESDFYNGTTYLDTMNAEAVSAFLHSTLDKYAEECGEMFGKEIFGVFTDEPHRGQMFSGFGISNANKARMTPYTGALCAAYKEKYGEELDFPDIYYRRRGEEENIVAARYIDVLDDLFTQNFARQYGDWCRAHGIILTGHILHEDNLSAQTSVSGSMMRFYEYMEYPGIDNLSAHNPSYWAVIQCASVARQTGKKFVLSELYGCTGWDMPLSEYKRIGDWQALLGINLRCPHLSWYTMKGEAKRDYPASILHQNSWYKDWELLETYFARIGIILTEGERRADLLVIHPVENMWKLVHKGWMETFSPKDGAVLDADGAFKKQCLELLALQTEFDYGDEELLAKYGSAEKDKQGALLRVGKAVYRRVLLAEGQAVRGSTRALLDAFVSLGGEVFTAPAQLSAGEVVSAPDNITSAVRRFNGDIWLFLLNLSEEESARGEVKLSPELSGLCLEEWDMVAFRNLGARQTENLSFAPGQMRVFRLTEKPTPTADKAYSKKLALPEKMDYKLSEPNVLVLDKAACTLDCKPWEKGKLQDVLLLDRDLREHFSLTPRGGEMVQPWFVEKYGQKDAVLGRLKIECTFTSEIECDVLVAAEYESIFFNGEPAPRTEGRWVDGCFRLFRAHVVRGRNTVSADLNFRRGENLEAVYILGNFGVTLPDKLVPLPEKLSPHDVGAQGLPFYGGAVSFHTGIMQKRVCVRAKELHGASLHVEGGEKEEIIAFAPYEADMLLRSELVLTVYFTRRNTFGPHHLIPQPQRSYGPFSWTSEGEKRTEDYILVEQGFKPEVYAAE